MLIMTCEHYSLVHHVIVIHRSCVPENLGVNQKGFNQTNIRVSNRGVRSS